MKLNVHQKAILSTQDTGRFIFGNLHNDRYIVVVIKSMSIDKTIDTNQQNTDTQTHTFSLRLSSVSLHIS